MPYIQAGYTVATLVAIIASIAFRIWQSRPQTAPIVIEPDLNEGLTDGAKRLSAILSASLPGSVIDAHDAATLKASMNAYWAQQECEAIPSCIVRPKHTGELSKAIRILKDEYNRRVQTTDSNQEKEGVFAIRSGGHSPVSGAASLKGGVVVDMSQFDEVTPSENGRSVVIGTGAKWAHVYRTLEKSGLAVVGGRNSEVGVGGLTLGGGLSFFSPRFGLVCNNVISYELVLADGSTVTASATEHPDLWRALKGGSNNFGIVTRFTARSFPCGNIWSGFLYIPGGQHHSVLSAFFDFLNRSRRSGPAIGYDSNAAGPLACFTYLQQINSRIISVNLVHTNPPPENKAWPACWAESGFAKIWRFWSDVKARSLASATDQMSSLNPPGRRQEFGTTTIKNDLETLVAVHNAYNDGIATVRNVKGISWTLVLQPMLLSWARKGDPNALGLDEGPEEPLVNVSLTVNWAQSRDDAFVEEATRKTIEQIEQYATSHGTGHRYRYVNYCGRWQKPFEGYGDANLRLLREVSRKYDPEGLFQQGCTGGFKIPG